MTAGVNIVWLSALLLLAANCQGQELVQQVCSADKSYVSVGNNNPDVLIGGLFEMRHPGSSGLGCDEPVLDLMQAYEAARFTIDSLNAAGYLGYTLGLQAYDTCSQPSVTLEWFEEMYPQTASTGCSDDNVSLLGIVGPMTSEDAIPAAKYASSVEANVISPKAMATQLSDTTEFKTFMRTIPSNAVMGSVVVDLLQQLQWETNLLIVYTDDEYGRSGFESILQAADSKGICVIRAVVLDPTMMSKDAVKNAINNVVGTNTYTAGVVVAHSEEALTIAAAVDEISTLASTQWIFSDLDITADLNSVTRARGAMVVFPSSPDANEFKDYFVGLVADLSTANSTQNPWFRDWYEAKYNCRIGSATGNLPQCSAQNLVDLQNEFVLSPWVVPTMKAVAAYAEVAKQICDISTCSLLGVNSPGDVMARLKGLTRFASDFPVTDLRDISVAFDANGDPVESDFTIYNYNARSGSGNFEKIGEFTNNMLTLTSNPVLYDAARAISLSTNPTAACPATGCTYCLKPQDKVQFRYTSGDIVIASLVGGHMPGPAPFTCGEGLTSRLLSLIAAEWAVDRYQQSNPSKLQGVSLGSLVADVCPDAAVAGGFLTDLLSGNNRLIGDSGSIIQADNIFGFVDQTDGEQALVISPILENYTIPEIQVETMMGQDLSMVHAITAVPTNDVLYEAITNILLGLGWNYVQVATESSGMYREMANTFKTIAGRQGICVLDMVDIDTDVNSAVTSLQSVPDSKVVVVIAEISYVRQLSTAINNAGATGTLQLVAGTEEFMTDREYSEAANRGSDIMFELEVPQPSDTFKSWLRGLSQEDIADHPFAREFIEIVYDCSLDTSTRSSYTAACGAQATFSSLSDMYYVGKAHYVIESVYTIAEKLDELIEDACGSSYTGVCSSFRSNTETRAMLEEKLRNIDKSDGFGTNGGRSTTNLMFYQRQGNTNNRFATFNTEDRRLTEFSSAGLISLPSNPTCSGACVECQYLFTLQTGVYIPGDWLIGGLFGVNNPGPEQYQPYMCGDIKTAYGPQFTTAMLYALEQVNGGAAPVSVKGVSVGGLALDHCSNPNRANLLVSSIYSSYLSQMGVEETQILSWLTDITMATDEAQELLDPLDVAVVSPLATSPDLMDYDNFYRTIQGDSTIATALVKIIKTLEFTYFKVVYSDSDYGQGGLMALTSAAQVEGICASSSFKIDDTSAAAMDGIVSSLVSADTHVVVLFVDTTDITPLMEAVARNQNARTSLFFLLAEPFDSTVQAYGPSLSHRIMSLRIQTGVLSQYESYLDSSAPLSNPYFVEYYSKLYLCDLPGYSTYGVACSEPLAGITANSGYVEETFVLSTINAVYATVDALDRTIREYCGDAYTEPCAEFLSAPDRRERFNLNLGDVNFVDEAGNSFRFLDREGNVIYDILQTNVQGIYEEVGSYAGVTLEIEGVDATGYADVDSECPAPCTSCIAQTLDFSYTPGDIYLAGVFDVHYGSTNPFDCGTTVKTLHGFLLLEAFHYALNEVNSNKGQFADILPGVTLGGIGVDACESEIRGAYLVSNINNGYMNLTREGNVISPSTIDAYVGSFGSRASIYLAQVLTDLEIPQISYSAGNPTLSDERYYPYFYRTVPSDTTLVEAILKFLDTEDIRYVQVVYEDTEEGIETKDYFVSMAASYRVCVAQTVNYPDINTISAETANDVVSRLIEKPSANTVVTFLNTGLIRAMLEAIERSEDARNKLRFIGSDDWADNQEATDTAGSQALNSVTLKLDSDDVEGFEQYINERTVANAEENPWFGDYYEAIHECYISKVDTKGYSEACSSTLSDTINQPNYQQDQGVVYVMDAVYAAAFALHETLKDKCGSSYSGVCQAYRNSGTRREELNENLQDVMFEDPDGMSFSFVNRSGNYGYRYYSIVSGVVSDAQYTEIGTYNATSGELMIDATYQNQVDSGCQREDACTECPLIRDNSVRYVTYDGLTTLPDDATTIVGFFDIHEQGVDPYRCGEINPEGFQQFLAFFYTIEKVLGSTVSGSSSSLNGIRVVAIDTCSNSLRVDQDLYGLLAGDGLCNSEFDDQIVLNLGNLGSVLTVGQLNTEAASRVLESPGVTYISPNALSPALDDEMHLVRSVTPISATMMALVSLFEAKGWTFVDTVYQESAESYYAVESLDELTTNADICLGSRISISDDDTNQDIETMLSNLNGGSGSKVVVLLGSQSFVKAVLNAASSLGVANSYLWVIAGTWEPTEAAIRDLGVASGVRLVTVYRRTWEVPTFRTHVNNLNYDMVHGSSNTNVPVAWYDEFFQLVFGCNLPNSERPRGEDLPTCDTSRRFTEIDWTTDPFILNTVAATYAAGSGLRNVLDTCGLSNCNTGQVLGSTAATRDFIKDNILSVEWDMRSSNDGEIAPTNLIFDMMNRWWDQGHDFKFWSNGNAEGMANSPGDLDLPAGFSTSRCTQTEAEGFCGCEITTPAGASSLTIALDTSYTPSDHRNYYRYQSDGDKTFDWPVWALPVGILTAIGIVMTVVLFLVLVCTYPVRGGTSVLGYMAILGIVCIYAINFAFFLHATDAVCGIRRFLLGAVYMITLAPLLVKAVDNWRYSHVDHAEGRYSGVSSACSLLMMAFTLVLIQCIIPIMWLILRHPTATRYYPETGSLDRHDNWWCDPPGDYDLGLVLSFSFVVFILLVTAGFSALAYDSKRNSYESRWILFSCVATGGCFLVWMVVTTNAGPPYRDPAVAIANFVNATVLMIVMPLRKSVLMCRAISEKNDEKRAMAVNGNGRPDYGYNREYDNPTYEMNDYENTFMDSKSEEF